MSPLQSYSLEIVEDDAGDAGDWRGGERGAGWLLGAASRLLLAGGAVVGAAAGDDDLLDGRAADGAGLAGRGRRPCAGVWKKPRTPSAST